MYCLRSEGLLLTHELGPTAEFGLDSNRAGSGAWVFLPVQLSAHSILTLGMG